MTDKILGYKVMFTYEIKEELVQEYYQFVMGQYVPALQAMGLQMSEAWQTAYGDAPNRLIAFICEDKATMMDAINSENWISFNDQLENFVTDFNYKVVPYRGGFQL